MTSGNPSGNDPESTFSFGVSELRRARVDRGTRMNDAANKTATDKQGGDPYNTSGSFDRTKNWMRVGKR